MHITSISAGEREIRFSLSAPVRDRKIRVSLFPAAVGEEGEICSVTLTVNGDSFTLSRHLSGRDGLTFRYVVTEETGEAEGKKYVEFIDGTDVLPPLSGPAQGVIVSDPAEAARAAEIGVRHAALFVSLSDFLMLYPAGDDTLLFRAEGREYYVRREAAEYAEEILRPLWDAGVSVTLILVNAREWLYRASDRLWDAVRHPLADRESEYALFDTVRETGCGYFSAFVTFLARRYAPCAMVIGYDVNDRAFADAGDISLEAFAEAYVTALRIAHQHTGGRVRIFAGLAESGAYSAADLLSALAGFSILEGQFPWQVSLHPAGDAAAAAGMLSAHLSRPEMLFSGERRGLILTEVPAGEIPEGVPAVFSVMEE